MNVIRSDDRALTNLGITVENRFNILWIDVQSLGRDDQVFLSAAIVESAFRIDLAEVARMEPTVICGCHAFTADEDFAVGRNHHVLSLYHFAERACSGIERMIDGNNRTGFRQPITLNNGKTALL